MEILSILFLVIGAIIAVVFGIQLLVTAFRTSFLWGMGYIFIPFVSLIFVVVHWDEAKTPFLRSLIAIPFLIVGTILAPGPGGMG